MKSFLDSSDIEKLQREIGENHPTTATNIVDVNSDGSATLIINHIKEANFIVESVRTSVFGDLEDTITCATETSEAIKTIIEENLTILLNQLSENDQAILRNARVIRDMERKLAALHQKPIDIMWDQSLEQLDGHRLLIIQQIYLSLVASQQPVLERLREQEQEYENNNNDAIEIMISKRHLSKSDKDL
ncbi:hypothetical protein BD770DRAFT_444899 [Pilaira anomala]|nr:hypothetical protein BD770DRAFT_444899 [Pilaira anomala]